jgi:hypothetical protein
MKILFFIVFAIFLSNIESKMDLSKLSFPTKTGKF